MLKKCNKLKKNLIWGGGGGEVSKFYYDNFANKKVNADQIDTPKLIKVYCL